ncbi:polysaccharide pyruvyl transferase family protein [Roseomonas frigidaquae]|uniref:Polysaccharide pyruvyl transferase family protein n=1 Tax=Falsiroseomonas frigidaquae TaxID=487318 RepID=A0ABX1F8K6_9PROT|nr:glycosyltransferase [Falsiroseomonas frigidaquae]NKE48660.1 polysaccharide pyruvyl transferase family protein [Falsiroseomonas frigidaquae]
MARSVCYCSFVDQTYMPGFLTLLKSLVANSSDSLFPFVVLHDGLDAQSLKSIAEIYPPVTYKAVDKTLYSDFVRGDRGNYLVEKAYYILEAFLIHDYDTVITLDTDMIVLGSIGELATHNSNVCAVPSFYDNPDGTKLNSGLLVLPRKVRGRSAFEALCRLGRSGAYELDKHDQGILSAHLDGNFTRLDESFNFVKRRIRAKLVPKSVRILHFTGPVKPWAGTEVGYEKAEARWHALNVAPQKLWSDYVQRHGDKGDPDFLMPFIASRLAGLPYDRETAAEGAALAIRFGRYDLIDVIVGRDTLRPGKRLSNILLYKGIEARVRGRFAESERWLRHPGLADPGLKVRVLAERAELHWIDGKLDLARESVEAARRLDPIERRVQKLGERIDVSSRLAQGRAMPSTPGQPRLTHVAFYMTPKGNAGDYLVPESVRWALTHAVGPSVWEGHHAHQSFGPEQVQAAAGTNAVVVGGGGLFIPDTAANLVSGWQWNVADASLRAMQTPLILFAVGYNVFFGKDRFSPGFDRSLALLVQKAGFVGIRNHGSIRQLRKRLPSHLHEKLVFQPCPTTVTRHLLPDLVPARSPGGFVALNCAYDRKDARFGQSYAAFLAEMAHLIRGLSAEREVIFYAHTVLDEEFLIDIASAERIHLPCRRLYDMSVAEILAAYSAPSVVVGMRGHASMIPFGCGTPIVSLISHPKMGYFLDDTKLREWGADISQPGFGEQALQACRDIFNDEQRAAATVDAAQQRLWTITQENLAVCRELILGPEAAPNSNSDTPSVASDAKLMPAH